MRQRPNFCCDCGEKIDRIEWHVWTSRRFCELCETRHRLDEWLPKILGGFCLTVGLFGIGSSIVRADRNIDLIRSPVKLAQQRAERLAPAVPDTESPGETAVSAEPKDAAQEPPRREPDPRPVRKPDKTAALPVYICGAETKKGTACTRRVKGGGRCWQHKGKEAIIAENELLISNSADAADGL